jgi:DNA modification methylase
MRDYAGIEGQIGMEETPEDYIGRLVAVFHEVHRVLKDNGTLWVNIGDSYNGSGKNNGNTKEVGDKQSSNTASHATRRLFVDSLPVKSLIGIPWRFALTMQSEWILRQDIIWAKPNPMPESVKDRFCKSHEYVFFFTKSKNYYFDHNAALEMASSYDQAEDERTYRHYRINRKFIDNDIACHQRGFATKEGYTGIREQHHGQSIPTMAMRTKRDVWQIPTEASNIEHYAMFPQRLILPCILCGCPQEGIVLDPFMGSGTTAIVAMKNLRKYIGCEINPDYVKIAEKMIAENKGLWD